MGESLKDQLLALGLGGKRPDRRPKGRKKAARPPAGPAPAKSPEHGAEPSLSEAWDLRTGEEHREAERKRQQALETERRRRETNRAIREIVLSGRQNDVDADIPRHFLHKGRIRKLYVTAGQQRALNEGELGIVYLAGAYHVVPSSAADAVRAISEEHAVDLRGGSDEDTDHPVPDDLTW